MARGEYLRFMAENRIENPEDIKKFDRLGYHSALIYHQMQNMFLNGKNDD